MREHYQYVHDIEGKKVYCFPIKPQVTPQSVRRTKKVYHHVRMQVDIVRADNVLTGNQWKFKTSDHPHLRMTIDIVRQMRPSTSCRIMPLVDNQSIGKSLKDFRLCMLRDKSDRKTMNEILKFSTDAGLDQVSLDRVEVGQYHVLNVGDGGFEARRISEVKRSLGDLSIRTGDHANSLRRSFSAGKKADILRESVRTK